MQEIQQKFVPKQRYVSQDFFDFEQAHIFSKHWIMAGLSSRIAQPRSHFVFNTPQKSFLITRDENGNVHAFYNSCLHRSTQLAQQDGSGALICPYHAWEYSHQGKLVNIPRPEQMQAAPCNQGRLKEVPCEERSGLVWICLQDSPSPIEDSLSSIFEGLDPYHLEEMRPIQSKDFHFSVNWKIALENALDYYHVPQVHRSTVGAHVKNEPTFEVLQRHNLQTLFIAPYPWRDWLDEKCARGGPYTDKQRQSLHKYFIFPNLILNVLPYHLTVMQLWPVDPQSCVMRYLFCHRKDPGILERFRAYGSWVASRWILYEDIQIYRGIQDGMNRSPFEEQPFHEQEQAIRHFHEELSRLEQS